MKRRATLAARCLLLVLAGCVTAAPDASHPAAIEGYFSAYRSGDFSRVPLAANVEFIGRVRTAGAADLRQELHGMAKATESLVVHRIAVTGDHGCAEFTLRNIEGTEIDYVDCFDFSGRDITAIRRYVSPHK